MFSLNEKNAYITGGASGIGRAVAEQFISARANVIIADIVDGTAVAKELGASFVHVDVCDEKSIATSLQESEAHAGKLDIVVLNAGVGDIGPTFTETKQKLIEKVTKINQWGVMYGLKHAPKHMNDGGSIISTSSMAAFINMVGSGVYSSTKRAVCSMTEMSALELGKRNIRVNSVCPGYIETAMGSGEEGRKLCETFTALGRIGSVRDVVGVFHFLASDASRYMTGQSLKVDGGWHCGPTEQLLELVIGDSHVS